MKALLSSTAVRSVAVVLLVTACSIVAQGQAGAARAPAPVRAPVTQQKTEATPTVGLSEDTPLADTPLPDISTLMHEVEKNQRAAEELRRKYAYREHSVLEETDGNGRVKKTDATVHEIGFVEGVLIRRLVEKDGKPLSDKDKEKEDEHVQKQVREAKEKKARAAAEGRATTSRGDDILPASRILELGTFSNPHRINFKGRSTIVVDYTGDPRAKSRNQFEGLVKDLVGTVWVDEKMRVLVRSEGHFLDNFHIAAGLLVNIQKGLSFSFEQTLVNGEIWLPSVAEGQGSARILLFVHLQGRGKTTFSDYRKFQSSASILPGVIEVPDTVPTAPDAAVSPKP